MPITAEQKANIGQRYVELIKARIKTRSDSHTKRETKETWRLPLAALAARRFGYKADHVVSCDTTNEWNGTERVHRLQIALVDKVIISVPSADVPGFNEALKKAQEDSDLARELCQEIAFLTSRLSDISAFQAYVGKLWAPANKSPISEATIKAMLEDFLTSKRPAVCKVGAR